MMSNRRSFLGSLLALLAAPFVGRAEAPKLTPRLKDRDVVVYDYWVESAHESADVVRHTVLWKVCGRAESADMCRGVVFPPIFPGWKRESSEYVLSRDGRELRCVFVDRKIVGGGEGEVIVG